MIDAKLERVIHLIATLRDEVEFYLQQTGLLILSIKLMNPELAASVRKFQQRLWDFNKTEAVQIIPLLEAVREDIRQQREQLDTARERQAQLKAEIEKLQRRQSQEINTSVGRDVSGEMNVAGRDVIKASPGELRDCPACGGEGRFKRMENGEKLIYLCPNCKGLGQVNLYA